MMPATESAEVLRPAPTRTGTRPRPATLTGTVGPFRHDADMSSEIEAVLAVAPPDLPDVALARLPAGSETDPFWRLAAAFLVGYPPATARAYLSDLRAWARAGVTGKASIPLPRGGMMSTPGWRI